MSEYIGSRISLISKSDIKYVGILKSIDSETATVSLQDVQCYGTEGRTGDPSREIAGSDVTYDGIVFRGSDVKDLTILAPPKENKQPQMPNDPAILGSAPQQQPAPVQPPPQPNQFRGPPPYQDHQQFHQGPPLNQFQHQSRFQGPGGPHGFPGAPGAVPAYGGFGPPPGYGFGYGPPPGHGFPPPPPGGFQSPPQAPIGPPGSHLQRPPPLAQQQQQQQQPQPQQPQQSPQLPIGSKQGPSQALAGSAPSPSVSSAPQNAGTPVTQNPSSATITSDAPPPLPIDSKPAPPVAAQNHLSAAAKAARSRVAVPLSSASPIAGKAQPKPAAPAVTSQAPAVQSIPANVDATDAATAAVAAAMAKLGSSNKQADGLDNLSQKVNQMRIQDGQARGRGRGRGAPRGGRREAGPKVEVPKEDFDFEGANAKFNKHELVKEAIASGSPIASPAGGLDTESTQTHSNGVADEVEDIVIPPKPAAEKGYDKKSSFFDNISSDLRDRAEQHQSHEHIDGRTMRREERSKNMETFGQGSVDGGYRGRGRGRGGRGGFRGGRGNNSGPYFNRDGQARGRGRGASDFTAPLQ